MVAVKSPWTEVDPVTMRLPVMTALPVNGNVGGAKLALVAFVAQLDVPSNDPVIPSVACMDPDMIAFPHTINEPVTSNPFGNATNPANEDAVAAV